MIDKHELPESVEKMLAGKGGPTAPLGDFVKAYNWDDNLWWKVECGHHQNLFEAALDWCDAKDAALKDAHRRIEQLEEQVAGNFVREMHDQQIWSDE